MRITCWGSRGSIPVSGPEFNRYGGDTTCLEIRTVNDDIIIVDAGTGIRPLGNKLFRENRRRFNFLFTHAHWDHLMGFPFFKPLYRENVELLLALLAIWVGTCSAKKIFTPAKEPLTLTILHTGNVYGQVLPCG